jgi:hypothetical protein
LKFDQKVVVVLSWFKRKDPVLLEPNWDTVMPKLARHDPQRHRDHPSAPVWRKFMADLSLEYGHVVDGKEAVVNQAQILAKFTEPELYQLALSHLVAELDELGAQLEVGYFVLDNESFLWGPELLLLPPSALIPSLTFLKGDPLVMLPCRHTLYLTGTAQNVDMSQDGLRLVADAPACKGFMARKAIAMFDGMPKHYQLSEHVFSVADGEWVVGERLVDIPLLPLVGSAEEDVDDKA